MEEREVPQQIPGQLEITVPSSSGAIGRWTSDDEFAAYAREKGVDKALEQQKLAVDDKVCNCGVQDEEDGLARTEERRPKKMPGHLHKAGCPQIRTYGKTTVRISQDEQVRRYAGIDEEGGS